VELKLLLPGGEHAIELSADTDTGQLPETKKERTVVRSFSYWLNLPTY